MISKLAARLQGSSTTSATSGIEVGFAKLCLRVFPSIRYGLYKHLARLLDADIDARSSLEFLYDVASNDGKSPNEPEAVAVAAWLRSFKEHGQLSEAVAGWVPQTEVLLLEAGERSGRFKHALDIMLRLNDKMGSIRSQLFGKVAYPLCMSLMLCGALYYLSTSFLPAIMAMRPDGNWTGTGASVVTFLTWVHTGLIPSLIGLALLIGLIIFTMPTFKGPVRNILDKLPPWSIYRFTSGTGFLTAILVLMESGRGLRDAISLARPSLVPYLADKAARIEAEVREGHDFGKALAASPDQFPDKRLIKEIQLFSRIGRLDEGLLNVVESWMDSATTRAVSQISILGMVMLMTAFAVLGFTMTGLYDMISQLKQGY